MAEIRDIPADIKELQPGDWVAFPWSYHGGDKDKEIMAAMITGCYNDNKLFNVCFSYGYQSISETLTADDIVAIGSKSGKERIKLYRGYYGWHILKPDNKFFQQHQEQYKDR